MGNISDPAEHIRKPFLPAIRAAVESARLASSAADEDVSKVLARASILHCCFVVEALANNLLLFVNWGSDLSKSLEKLDPISKIELFARFLPEPKMVNRGDKSIQVLNDFIRLRNSYAHPKILKRGLREKRPGVFEAVSKDFKFISLEFDPERWSYQEAKASIKALVVSVDQLLLDVLRLDKKFMSCAFLDVISIGGARGPVFDDVQPWITWLVSDLNCPPKFYVDHIVVGMLESLGSTKGVR